MTSGLLEADRTAPAGYVDVPLEVPPRHRPRWATVLVATVLLVATGLVVSNEVQTVHQFNHTQQTLDATQSQLAVARADLAQLQHNLQVVDGQISQSQTALNDDFAKLLQTQQALSKSEGTVSSQSASIDTLQTCLGGVTQALNALSVGDQQTAIAALNKVTSSCQSAVVENG